MLSILNITGLSIGIASFLVITLYIFQETSYEKGFEDWNRIYRVETHFLSTNKIGKTVSNVQFFLSEIPGVESHATIYLREGVNINAGESSIKTEKLIWSTDKFFNLFDYDVIHGNPDSPLEGPGKAVITRSMAKRLFGRTDVLGERIESPWENSFLVSAVIEDPVIQSHLDFDILLYDPDKRDFSDIGWYDTNWYTFVKLSKNSEQIDLDEGLNRIVERHVFPIMFKAVKGMSFQEWMEQSNRISFHSRPISDIHLESELEDDFNSRGDKATLMTLGIIAVFILTIASINFMNLTTARSSYRTREIGVRKVLGSPKRGLIFQFMAESLLITLISAIVAAAMTEVLIVQINQNFGNVIGISLLKYPELLVNVGLGVIAIGLVSGIYPAFYLSGAKVVPLLKGMKVSRVFNMSLAKRLRNTLVVLQFTLSTGLIIATFFMYNQLVYLKNKDLGFDKEQVLVINNPSVLKNDKEAFKNEILNIPGVEAASFTHRVPGRNSEDTHSLMLDDDRTIVMSKFNADLDLLSTLGLEISEGNWFSEELVKTDSNVVINEAALHDLGIEDSVGKLIGDYYRIVGVVKDFNFGSPKEEIGPVMFGYNDDKGRRLVVRIDLNSLPVDQIKEKWTHFTQEPLSYRWIEQDFEELLIEEENVANIVTLFTILAVIISCIGLFGLVAFAADERLQEFSIRKVLGASAIDIIKVFSYDFMKLVGLAFIISIPLTVIGVKAWLQEFAYRVDMKMGLFVVGGILAIVIAFLTILFQSIKTASKNPVETLKSE